MRRCRLMEGRISRCLLQGMYLAFPYPPRSCKFCARATQPRNKRIGNMYVCTCQMVHSESPGVVLVSLLPWFVQSACRLAPYLPRQSSCQGNRDLKPNMQLHVCAYINLNCLVQTMVPSRRDWYSLDMIIPPAGRQLLYADYSMNSTKQSTTIRSLALAFQTLPNWASPPPTCPHRAP